MKRILKFAVLLGGLAVLPLRAQYAVPPPTPVYQPLSDQQMDQLVGPIALYPDPLLAQLLPASTLPTEIVLADRYVTGGGDPNQIESQPWDASVQAMAHYPTVLKWMDDNLNWTTALGQAFLNQPQDVMDSIQRLRAQAQSLGNLQSGPQEQVEVDDGTIDIEPTDPDMMYLPTYAPDSVYYQPGFGITYGVGFPFGVWLNGDFDWHNHNLISWDRDHPRPANWWHDRPAQRDNLMRRQTTVWHPEDHRTGGVVNRSGDRGWEDRSVVRTAAPVVTSPGTTWDTAPHEAPARDVEPHNAPVNISRPEPVQVQRVEPVGRPAPSPAGRAASAPAAPANGGQQCSADRHPKFAR